VRFLKTVGDAAINLDHVMLYRVEDRVGVKDKPSSGGWRVIFTLSDGSEIVQVIPDSAYEVLCELQDTHTIVPAAPGHKILTYCGSEKDEDGDEVILCEDVIAWQIDLAGIWTIAFGPDSRGDGPHQGVLYPDGQVLVSGDVTYPSQNEWVKAEREAWRSEWKRLAEVSKDKAVGA